MQSPFSSLTKSSTQTHRRMHTGGQVACGSFIFSHVQSQIAALPHSLNISLGGHSVSFKNSSSLKPETVGTNALSTDIKQNDIGDYSSVLIAEGLTKCNRRYK